jgi:hypothetical protein
VSQPTVGARAVAVLVISVRVAVAVTRAVAAVVSWQASPVKRVASSVSTA